MQPVLVAREEAGGDNGAEQCDKDEARDAEHPGQDAVCALVAQRLGLELPPVARGGRVCKSVNTCSMRTKGCQGRGTYFWGTIEGEGGGG